MNFNNKLKVRAISAPWHNGVDFLIRQDDAIAENIVLKRKEDGAAINPTFTLTIDTAQALMDDLWMAGLRPTEGSGSAGSLRATEKHLADMRKIAFNQLGIEDKK